MTDFPHFSLPFRFVGDHVAVSEQDSYDEIGDCVELTLRTVEGQRSTLPEFGRPEDLEFTTNRDLARAQVQQSVDEAEPRVASIIEAADLDTADTGLLRLIAMYTLDMEGSAG